VPRLIPTTPNPDAPISQRRAFTALERQLGDGWLVVHEPRWVGRSRPGEPLQDGGCDFLIAHPEFGLLMLQVVDGGVVHEPSSQRWTCVDLDGTRRTIEDPFQSAAHAMELLLGKLAEHPGATPSRPTHGHAVLLADVQGPSGGFAAHAPADITLDLRHMDRLGASVEQVLKRWQRRQPATGNASSRWWWRALEDLFLMPREARLLLRHRIAEEQRQMVLLSPQQLGVLDMLARVRRQAVYGCAGTGKTLLAMHKARMLARQGMSVLLTCYNKALGHHLREAMADEPNVHAIHFHELCYEVTGLDPATFALPPDQDEKQRFFDDGLARRVMAVTARHGPAYDALVVDEAQDFLPLWWHALDSLLIEPARAVRYLFFDDAQCLRADAAPVAGAATALTLTTNWRNTRNIHEHLVSMQPELQVSHSVAPPGVPVAVEPLQPNLGRAVRRVLGRVLGEGGVPPEDVVILTGEAHHRSPLTGLDLAPYRLTWADEPGAVRVRGVRAFKGMEAPVVILTGLSGYQTERARQLHYIGASRATNHLVVLQDAMVPPVLAVGGGDPVPGSGEVSA
jgi:hypothetical protein